MWFEATQVPFQAHRIGARGRAARSITENVNAHVQVEHDPTLVEKQNVGDEFGAKRPRGLPDGLRSDKTPAQQRHSRW
jgi:hypothetical protein